MKLKAIQINRLIGRNFAHSLDLHLYCKVIMVLWYLVMGLCFAHYYKENTTTQKKCGHTRLRRRNIRYEDCDWYDVNLRIRIRFNLLFLVHTLL